MRQKFSKQVDNEMNRLFATLASVAARNALECIRGHNNDAAEKWAKITGTWLHRAGAHAAACHFNQPKL